MGGREGRQEELLDGAVRRDASEAAVAGLGGPQVAVRGGGDAVGTGARGGQGELGDDAGGGDATDAVAAALGEPQVAVGAGGDAGGGAAGVGQWVGRELLWGGRADRVESCGHG